MIFEGGAHLWREIYMDGREFPKTSTRPDGLFNRAWEGDTLSSK